MVRTQVLRSARELDRAKSLWAGACPPATPFQSFLWNRLASDLFSGREEPHVIVSESATACTIIPAALRADGSVGLLGETLFDYRTLLSTGDPQVEHAAWCALAETSRPFELMALMGEAERDRWSGLNPQPFCNAPGVALAHTTRAEFLAAHSRLGRHARRIAKRGIAFKRRPGADSALVREIYRRKADSNRESPSLFLDPLRREFMEAICAADPSCEVFTYETSGDLAAAIVTFASSATRHFYTIYFDARWADLSPGQVLLFEAAAATLGENLNCDFMTGEYPYKNRLANTHVPLYRVQASAAALCGLAERRTASHLAA